MTPHVANMLSERIICGAIEVLDAVLVQEMTTAALISLQASGVSSDTLGMLTGGDERRTIPPGVMAKAIGAALGAYRQSEIAF